MADLTTWPTWEIQFDRSGNVDPAARAALLTEIPGAGITDLVVMSHGWNSSPDHSRVLYKQWFGMLDKLVPDGTPAQIGTLGVIWPSMLWPDETPPGGAGGGGAAVRPGWPARGRAEARARRWPRWTPSTPIRTSSRSSASWPRCSTRSRRTRRSWPSSTR